MYKSIKQLIKTFILFLKVDWGDTIRLNLFHLPFRQGIKFPILLFKARLHIMHGSKIRILVEDKDCCFGMIKLGCQYSRNVLSSIGIQIDLRSTGGLVFKGSGIMGCGSNIVTRNKGIIVFGRNFGVSGNFSACSFQKIEIGDNLSSSWNVSIYDTDFHELEDVKSETLLPMTCPVAIGNNCWICQHTLLLKGAKLPDWSIVGTYSLVNKDYATCPPHTLFVGIPAKAKEKKMRRTDFIHIMANPEWKITSGLHLLNALP